jgi:ribokinase
MLADTTLGASRVRRTRGANDRHTSAVAAHVVVFGSVNVDLVVAADRLPRPGETVLGGRFEQHPGGKGANQAVAAARAGASVAMIGAVGGDRYGDLALQALEAEGIDVSRVRRVDEPTGVAIIAVGPRGENQIVVAPGANGTLSDEDADLSGLEADLLLAQLEVPMAAVVAALQAAAAAGMTSILDPAPAHALPASVLELAPILIPNEHELTVAIGNDDPEAALDELLARHHGPVVVTQGAAGALLARNEERRHFPGRPAGEVVDTTGAGDAFAGVLATWLAEGHALENAIHAANVAGSISVGQRGARSGMPMRDEIEAAL